ncbi:MAG: 1,4-alpha-glucan-branching enzyme, partial [Muribaculaceae bacterium]
MKAKSDTTKAKTTTKASAAKTTSAKPRRTATRRKAAVLPIIKNDPWLEPYAEAITGRHQDAINKKAELTGGTGNLNDFANAHKYFGLHRGADGSWVFREWAPNATAITLIGDFSQWREEMKYSLSPVGNGVWEIKLAPNDLKHGQLYKMMVHWPGGMGERIPAYVTRVVQDETTHIFSAQVWAPEHPYQWTVDGFKPDTKPLLIYECHIGMAQEREGVGSYDEFR